MKIYKVLRGALAAIVLITCLWIWPGKAVHNTESSSSRPEINRNTGAVTQDSVLEQTFIPQKENLHSVGLLVDRSGGECVKGTLDLEISDENGNAVWTKTLPMTEVGDRQDGYFMIDLDAPLEQGKSYILKVTTEGTENQPVSLLYRSRSGAGPEENQALALGGSVIQDASLACEYTYWTSVGKRQVLVYDMFFVTMFLLLSDLLRRMDDRRQRNQ